MGSGDWRIVVVDTALMMWWTPMMNEIKNLKEKKPKKKVNDCEWSHLCPCRAGLDGNPTWCCVTLLIDGWKTTIRSTIVWCLPSLFNTNRAPCNSMSSMYQKWVEWLSGLPSDWSGNPSLPYVFNPNVFYTCFSLLLYPISATQDVSGSLYPE
jgi:hypothetical protein